MENLLCDRIFGRYVGNDEEKFLYIAFDSANSYCEVIFMKKHIDIILAGGLVLSILISNGASVIRDGRQLDKLRGSVLRLHILAESDSEHDQNLKLKVRDGLLESGIFETAETLEEAEAIAAESLDEIEEKAEDILRKNGCNLPVSAELADVVFDERVYGDITMPAGEYRALRVKIGSAQGKNWWCVMYPPLCLPAACTVGEKSDEVEKSDEAEEYFTDEEKDILHHPKKYEIRFAIWDKIKSLIKSDDVQNDENADKP